MGETAEEVERIADRRAEDRTVQVEEGSGFRRIAVPKARNGLTGAIVVIGALVAVPLLSAIKVCCDRYDPLHPVATFLDR